MILQGDCVEQMRSMDEASVDAVVCDPPYGLEFMGKEWDRLWGRDDALPRTGPDRNGNWNGEAKRPRYEGGHVAQEWHHAWATEALRVLKPGGHLLAFGGTRTYHRLACAIEDAGFEIRDCLVWMYGSGFPKSHNLNGDREGWGTALKPAHEPIVLARKPLSGTVAQNVLEHGTGALNIDRCRIESSPPDQKAQLRANTPGAGRYVNTDSTIYGGGNGIPMAQRDHDPSLGRWPANVALDPEAAAMLDEQSGELGIATTGRKTVAHESTIKAGLGSVEGAIGGYGDSGGASRFFYCAKSSRGERNAGLDGFEERPAGVTGMRAPEEGEKEIYAFAAPEGLGAWLRAARDRKGLSIKEVAAHFPSASGGVTGCVWNWENEANRPTVAQWLKLKEILSFGDEYDEAMTTLASVPREATTLEGGKRGRSLNHHPTVKPIDLMRWLVRLVTPPGGTVLDPFTGSGTTGIAAALEGFDFIGIERESEYVEIARARIEWWSQFPGEDTDEILIRAGLSERLKREHEERGQIGLLEDAA